MFCLRCLHIEVFVVTYNYPFYYLILIDCIYKFFVGHSSTSFILTNFPSKALFKIDFLSFSDFFKDSSTICSTLSITENFDSIDWTMRVCSSFDLGKSIFIFSKSFLLKLGTAVEVSLNIEELRK